MTSYMEAVEKSIDDAKWHKFAFDVLHALGFESGNGDLWWRCDGQYAPLTFLVNCGDVFWWGCADCEELKPEHLPVLKKALEDSEGAGERGSWATLYCARVRRMRPQGALYKYHNEAFCKLLNDCGPEREINITNPAPPTPKGATTAEPTSGEGSES